MLIEVVLSQLVQILGVETLEQEIGGYVDCVGHLRGKHCLHCPCCGGKTCEDVDINAFE